MCGVRSATLQSGKAGSAERIQRQGSDGQHDWPCWAALSSLYTSLLMRGLKQINYANRAG
jgi:hypothetical protein